MSNRALYLDFDGTLYNGSYFVAFFLELIKRGLLPDVVMLRAEQARHSTGHISPMVQEVAYVDELLSAVFEQRRLKGMLMSDVHAVCKQLAQNCRTALLYFTDALVKLAKSSGYQTIIITGSPTVAVSHFATLRGDIDRILGTELGCDSFLGELTGEKNDSVFREKKRAVETDARDHDIDLNSTIIIGNGRNDLPMIELAGFPIVINPYVEALSVARQRLWPVIIETSNYIHVFQGDCVLCSLNGVLPSNLAQQVENRLLELTLFSNSA